MPPKPPSGIEVPEIPAPLPPGTPLVDRRPQDPQRLPAFAQAWPTPTPPRVAPTQALRTTQLPARNQTDIDAAIIETHRGVEALQVLIEPPEEPTRAETILELLEALDTKSIQVEARQRRIEAMLGAVLTHLRLPIPKG